MPCSAFDISTQNDVGLSDIVILLPMRGKPKQTLVIAQRGASRAALDAVPMGPIPERNNNMILDWQNGKSQSGFGHSGDLGSGAAPIPFCCRTPGLSRPVSVRLRPCNQAILRPNGRAYAYALLQSTMSTTSRIVAATTKIRHQSGPANYDGPACLRRLGAYPSLIHTRRHALIGQDQNRGRFHVRIVCSGHKAQL
jgi:hypothetical protein